MGSSSDPSGVVVDSEAGVPSPLVPDGVSIGVGGVCCIVIILAAEYSGVACWSSWCGRGIVGRMESYFSRFIRVI